MFQNIAKKMVEQGCSRDGEQCKIKIKNLKKQYRAVKDHNGETGSHHLLILHSQDDILISLIM